MLARCVSLSPKIIAAQVQSSALLGPRACSTQCARVIDPLMMLANVRACACSWARATRERQQPSGRGVCWRRTEDTAARRGPSAREPVDGINGLQARLPLPLCADAAGRELDTGARARARGVSYLAAGAAARELRAFFAHLSVIFRVAPGNGFLGGASGESQRGCFFLFFFSPKSRNSIVTSHY